MIRKHTRRAAKAAFAISLGVAIVIGLLAAVFARPAHARPAAGPTIVIGTKNFGEEYILGELYKQALEAKGFTISYKENIGSTEIIQIALTSGKINFYPEYTGVIVQDVYHHTISPKTAAGDLPARQVARGGEGLSRRSRPTPFYDTDVLAVTNATAKKYGLKSIGDLKKVGAFKLGGFPRVQDAQHLLPRLHEAVRADERDVRPARSDLGVRRARPGRACSPPTSSRPTRRSASRPSTRCSRTRSTSPGSRTCRRS